MVYKSSSETQLRKNAKKQHILDCSARVFATMGYHNTSVRDIIAEAGISTGSFYFYFKSKEELFASLYDEISQKHWETIDKVVRTESCNLAASFTRAITTSLWLYQERRDLARIMLIEALGLNREFRKRWHENVQMSLSRMSELFRTLQEKGIIHIPDPDSTAKAFEGTCYYVILEWLENDDESNLTDLAYPLVIYNLQAIDTHFEYSQIKEEIENILTELKQGRYR